MAGNLTENFHDLCRLCASKFNLIYGVNIFENSGSARDIVKKISICLPIQVHQADHLPKIICAECIIKLDTFFTFREKTVETENFFIELVRKENNKINIKIKEPKTMEITTTINEQQLIASEHQELLNHPNINLPHIATRENIIVNQEIMINSDNIVIHNHELENIEIAPNELNSHNMSHETIHNQQLIHHEIAPLVHPHLNLIHPEHALISGNYEQIPEKDITNINTNNTENCIEGSVLALNSRKDDISFVKVEAVDIKCETQNETDPLLTEGSDSEESSDAESDNGENLRNDILIESNMYDEQNQILLNASEMGTSESNEVMGYYCNVCGTTFNEKDDYLDHYSEHLNRCLFCQTDFENVESLKAHKKQMHARKSPNGNLQSDKIQTRTRHKSERKDKIDENFFKEETSDDDNNMPGENTTEFINDADNDNDNDEDDDVDSKNHKNGKRKRWEPKVCKECGKSYKTNYKLAEHMRKHTGETPYKCTMCDKAFRSKIGLAQHEAKHTGQYDYSCPTCGKGFQCKSYLIVHQRVHSTLKPYPCGTCGRNFKTKQSLLDHENRHLGVKPYMCDICGRGFITKGLCKSHQKVHSGRDNRQFPCSVCNKLFVSKSYLNTHVKIHTGEKPFICEVCGKGFLTRVDLKIHSTMHTGEKSFVCEICGKAFARRDALRCHRRSHTGERPYRCDICGQTFTQFSPMAIHKRLHTGERPYSCDVCRKTFVSRSTMMSHKKKHNQNETEANIVSS